MAEDEEKQEEEEDNADAGLAQLHTYLLLARQQTFSSLLSQVVYI